MSACGKAHDGNAAFIYAEMGAVLVNVSHGSGRFLQCQRIACGGAGVAKNKALKTACQKFQRNDLCFTVRGHAVAAAGADENCRPGAAGADFLRSAAGVAVKNCGAAKSCKRWKLFSEGNCFGNQLEYHLSDVNHITEKQFYYTSIAAKKTGDFLRKIPHNL